MPKRYDRAYFERWYHSRRRVVSPAAIRRKAKLALAATEYFLDRPVRTVLDVGCGEGLWRAELRRLRPRIRYVGVDPSEYVVRRYGRSRNIVRGGFGDLPGLELDGPFDLIVCADVLQYVSGRELSRGLPELARLLDGIAWIEAYTADDGMEGDRSEFHLRTESAYRRLFERAGLAGLGLNCWVPRAWLETGRVGRMEGVD